MQIDKRRPTPVYMQLKELLQAQIKEGVYSFDEQLPSERDLAKRYNLSRMTARRALVTLVEEGLAYTIVGKGTFANYDPFKVFYNPYIAGPPITNPKMFFGRQAYLDKVTSLLLSNFVMLTGERRIGKTSLLHQLGHHLKKIKHLPEQFVPVLINLEGTPSTEFFHTIMEEILSASQDYLPPETISKLTFEISSFNYSARNFSHDLQTILKNLKFTSPQPSRLVLLLDEMDVLNTYNLEIQSQLRRIFQRFTNQNFSVVVAGVRLRQHWAGESSPFYNMFIPVELPPFSKREAHRLITEPVQGVFHYSDEAIELIMDVTAGLPNRIQQLCLEIIHHLQVASKERTSITVEDVDIVLQKIHWLDQEIDPPRETTSSSVPDQLPVIAETTPLYDTKDLGTENQEEEE